MKAMILAAGFGERLRPLTDKTPKPLLQVGGKPIIQYHIENLVRAGVREIVINTSWLGEMIESYLGNGARFGAEIFWSRETQPLETGGGIRRALPHLGSEPFLVINGDVWSDYPLETLSSMVLSEEMDAHLVLVQNPPFKSVGDFSLVDENRISYPTADSKTYTFSGISLMRPDLFALYPAASEKFALRDVLTCSINSRSITGEVFENQWWDLGTVERLEMLNTILSGKPIHVSKKPRVRQQTA